LDWGGVQESEQMTAKFVAIKPCVFKHATIPTNEAVYMFSVACDYQFLPSFFLEYFFLLSFV
jgi:hypothetical protein